MKALLKASHLSLPRRLLDVSLELEAGELACLIGPNGSGKTSLLHAIAGIGSPGGEVRIAGTSPAGLAPAQRIRLLTFLPATKELRWPLAARDLIALGGASAEETDAAIARLDLGSLAERRVDRLSTGERSRVLIARALAPQPKLLLLDEPTANLDPLWQILLVEMLRDELKRTGRAALVTLHDLDAAGRHADRIIVMEQGRIAADGAPGAILASDHIPRIFGIERAGGSWRPARRQGRPGTAGSQDVA